MKSRGDYHLTIKVLLCWSCSLMGIHTKYKYYCVHSKRYLHTSNYVPSKSILNYPNNYLLPQIRRDLLSNYLSRQNEQLETLLQVLPTGRISFQHCTSESSLSMETVLQIYPPSDGTSIWCRTICKLGLSFFLPQSTGTPLKATGVGWEWRKEAWVWTTRYIKYSIIKGYKIIIGLLFLKKKKCAECTHKQKTSKRKFINILVVTPGWSNMGDLIFMFFCIEFFQ